MILYNITYVIELSFRPIPHKNLSYKYKMVCKSTQRSNKRVQRTRRARKVGGAETCASALEKVLPDEGDYERMVDYDSSAIDNTQSYDEFVAFQRTKVEGLSAEDCAFVLSLIKRIRKKEEGISLMDFESCAAFRAGYLFFDTDGKLVIGNPR